MRTAVSASDDGTLMLWDTLTGHDAGVLSGHRSGRSGNATQLHHRGGAYEGGLPDWGPRGGLNAA